MVAAAAKLVSSDPRYGMGGGGDLRAQRGGSKAGHPVANRQIRDTGADRPDDPGAFEPESRAGKAIDQRFFR